ncbi:MAG: hypothetical protein WCP26_02265 [Actinomycetes bacterium]
MSRTTGHEPFLGRDTRVGPLAELGRGTYRVILDAIDNGDWATAVELLPITIQEAEELHDVYGAWPSQIVSWCIDAGADTQEVAAGRQALLDLIADGQTPDWEGAWTKYVQLTSRATELCQAQQPTARAAVLAARDRWMLAHDQAVDHVYGLLDLAVRLHGEECLPTVWNHLMSPWYDEHARRLSRANQPWEESARQLSVAILDGFHGHLAGADRLGDVEVIEEPDRVGFRFAPCGSGGRVMDDATTDGTPRMEPPYRFAVTSKAYDWSFGKAGVCAYCVHCCLLNMTEPTDRLGHPTRVIEPPIWPASREGSTCTWWVYRDVDDVPDEVYHQIGRRRPASTDEEAT